MSVQTTADEKRDSALDSIQSAIEDLGEIVVGECYGHDGFHGPYTKRINEAFQLLIQGRGLLQDKSDSDGQAD